MSIGEVSLEVFCLRATKLTAAMAMDSSIDCIRQVNFRMVELVVHGANTDGDGGGGRTYRTPRSGVGRSSAGGRGLDWRHGRSREQEQEQEHTAFKSHLVGATKGFIEAIMVGKKKWSALVQQVRETRTQREHRERRSDHGHTTGIALRDMASGSLVAGIL